MGKGALTVDKHSCIEMVFAQMVGEQGFFFKSIVLTSIVGL